MRRLADARFDGTDSARSARVSRPKPRASEPSPDAETTDAQPPSSGGPLEGADAGAIGTAAAPETAPPGALVDDSEHRVPGAGFERPLRESKPWFTSLAAESEQAGVGNEGDEPRD